MRTATILLLVSIAAVTLSFRMAKVEAKQLETSKQNKGTKHGNIAS